jgi:hypothetical protein
MPGAVAYGFHEGGRSEYLAQYVFGSWGTAVAIPHEEDHGIDLTCTLMERVGNRNLARWPYTVQVKSDLEPVVFDGIGAARWVIEHPLPLFLCVVDKPSCRLSVYHTLPRFYAWSLGEWPERLEIIPEARSRGQDGRCTHWTGRHSFGLDQPILDFTVNEMLDNEFWSNARKVFSQWIEIDNDNLARVGSGLLKCRMPSSYRTNDCWVGGWSEFWLQFPNLEQFDQTTVRLKEPIEWIADQLLRKGDYEGAAKAALVHRHLFPKDLDGPLGKVQHVLNDQLRKNTYDYAGVDHLGALIQTALAGEPAEREKSCRDPASG